MVGPLFDVSLECVLITVVFGQLYGEYFGVYEDRRKQAEV
jgi:hypothetical protein